MRSIPTKEAEVVAEIARVASELTGHLQRIIDQLGSARESASELGRSLGVNRVLAHRLLTAIAKKDPLATAHAIPGPEPLRRMLRAARRKGAAGEDVEQALESVGNFAELIQSVGGDRTGLDAIISSSLPDARARIEATAKQSVYRGMRQLRGIAADVCFQTSLIRPSLDDEERHDWVAISGLMGVRRVRPGAQLKLGIKSGASLEGSQHVTLAGEPVDDLRGLVLHDFCSGPPVEIEMQQVGTRVMYLLDWADAVGSATTRDIVVGELYRSALRRHRPADDPRPKAAMVHGVEVPTRMGIYDIVLHRDAYPDWEPQVRILETGERGSADPNDPTRDNDVLDVLARVDSLGWRVERFRIEEVPGYVELLTHACSSLDWDPAEFRGYRCRIEYPIFNSQVQFVFDVPIA